MARKSRSGQFQAIVAANIMVLALKATANVTRKRNTRLIFHLLLAARESASALRCPLIT
jgi:hypothetical protein